jgi:hypothetical protein
LRLTCRAPLPTPFAHLLRGRRGREPCIRCACDLSDTGCELTDVVQEPASLLSDGLGVGAELPHPCLRLLLLGGDLRLGAPKTLVSLALRLSDCCFCLSLGARDVPFRFPAGRGGDLLRCLSGSLENALRLPAMFRRAAAAESAATIVAVDVARGET